MRLPYGRHFNIAPCRMAHAEFERVNAPHFSHFFELGKGTEY